jgi:hypothetical protein
MHIATLQVNNYKSFSSSEELRFTPGFNVIVGQNNVGKTALVEALSLQFGNQPHRSLKTAPTSLTTPDPYSQMSIRFELSKDELADLLINYLPAFYVPVTSDEDVNVQTQRFQDAISGRNVIKAVFESGQIRSASLEAYDDRDSRGFGVSRLFRIDPSDKLVTQASEQDHNIAPSQHFAAQLANILKDRIYRFSAERLNVSEFSVGYVPNLAPNASNLPQVLNILQTTNPPRFQRFNQLVSTILPEVRQITAPVQPDGLVRIFV